MAGCLCDQCAGLCCRYFALPIDNPDCKRDYDNIRWYLLHDKVVIFVEDKQWYIGILTRCKQLQPDNRCGIYETRPAICRSYSTDNCDYHAGDYGYDLLFTSPEALWEYAAKKLREDKAAGKKKKPKKKKSRATRARQLSRTLGIPEEITAGAMGASAGGAKKSNGNGRSVPLKILGR
jgi:Fe-S-cluster containining protein